mgnify:CR=1 FL=1
MSEMNNKDDVIVQYKDDSKFKKRQNFHDKYSINKYGFRNWMFDKYKIFDGCKILELGCGNGIMWDEKYKELPQNVELVISDFSEGMCNIVKQKHLEHNNVQVEQIDIQKIPYKDETFDIVIANHMLCHVSDVDKAIEEVHRVLKNNGIFYASTLGTNGFQKYLNQKFKEFNLNMNYFNIENWSFTLKNGKEVLEKKFNNIQMDEYKDSIEISDENVFVEWIFTSVVMQNLDKNQFKGLAQHFAKDKDEKGIIHIPKQIGCFIAIKD